MSSFVAVLNSQSTRDTFVPGRVLWSVSTQDEGVGLQRDGIARVCPTEVDLAECIACIARHQCKCCRHIGSALVFPYINSARESFPELMWSVDRESS